MIIQTRKVYMCEHCKKKYFVKGVCAKHELKCSKRPGMDNICWKCKHLHIDVTERIVGDSTVVESKKYFCLAKDVVLKVSVLGSSDAVRMPNLTCSDYEGNTVKELRV